jgi:hypothetical protein
MLSRSRSAEILTTDVTPTGHPLMVVSHQQGHYCGYLQQAHQYDGGDDRPSIDESGVPGGWTYGPDEAGWVGFDTAHAGMGQLDPDGAPREAVGQPDPAEYDSVTWWRPCDVHWTLRALAPQLDPPADDDREVRDE